MTFDLPISDSIVAVILLLGVLQGILMGIVFLLRPTGNKKANTFFALLLGVVSLSLLNLLLVRLDVVPLLPIWLTLSFGPLFFYFIKFSLFPSYELRWTDAKHFALPLWQILFAFFIPYLNDVGWQNFIQFFYRNFEHLLFVITFLTYLLLGYRYVRYKLAVSRHRTYNWEQQKINRLRGLIRVLVVLIGIYGFLLVSDFVVFYLLQINLHQVTGFAYVADLCFAAMVYWMGYNAYKMEFFSYTAADNEVSKKKATTDVAQIQAQLEQQKWYLDPGLKPSHLAAALHTTPAVIQQVVLQERGQSFHELINYYRVDEVKKRLVHPRFANYNILSIGLEAGFSSKAKFYWVFKKVTGLTPQAYKKQFAAEQVSRIDEL